MTSRAPLAVSPTGPQIFQAIVPGASQVVSYTGTSGASTAFAATTSIVRLVSDQNCYIKFAATPTATSSDMLLIAGIPEYFGVSAGAKVAALKVSSDGSLWVTEGSL